MPKRAHPALLLRGGCGLQAWAPKIQFARFDSIKVSFESYLSKDDEERLRGGVF